MSEVSEALRQALAGTRSPTLADVNELVGYHSDFQIQSFDGHRLLVVGSFDLCYYHYIEVHFIGVDQINCPVRFSDPEFTDEGLFTTPWSSAQNPRRFAIRANDGQYDIIAETVEVIFGTVFYYDRGEQLQPGERIAEWVKRVALKTGSEGDGGI